MPTPPVILAFPFLSLERPVQFGPWWLGRLAHFDGQWLSPDFEVLARRFLRSFRDASNEPIKEPSILARQGAGADGVPPTIEEREAIAAAVGYGVIDQNPYWTEEDSHHAWRVGTADNADFWIQPLSADGAVALGRGYRVSTTTGGQNVNDESFCVAAPLELHMPTVIRLDTEVVQAVYSVLSEPVPGDSGTARRIKIAIQWLLKSWQNTPSITWEDRLVFVKVATEAISGKSDNADSAKALEALFQSASQQDGQDVGVDDLLWQAQQPRFERTFQRSGESHTEEVSAFVDWAMELGRARNKLVHGNDGVSVEYEKPGSAFNGPFVEIGDRVIREAIGLLLGEAGFAAVWRRGIARASYSAMEHF